jgi:hypothetical protein
MFTVQIKSGLYWSHCTDTNEENKFMCSSEDLWSPQTQISRRGVHDPYMVRLPKSQFANDLLEPNDGYIEPCYSLTSDSMKPENFTLNPSESNCLDPKPYLCRKEISHEIGMIINNNKYTSVNSNSSIIKPFKFSNSYIICF